MKSRSILDLESRFYRSDGTSLTCTLCPHRCNLLPGQTGLCGVRQNHEGRLALPFAGAISAMQLDPIEKKPLFHFYPGSHILSIGFLGCNFQCPFCQNYQISQSTARSTKSMTPQQVVAAAIAAHSLGIAYTYNEPTIHFEFVQATARAAREAGLKNVLVTNGHLNPKPAGELLPLIDAVNVDLKSFSSDFYQKQIGGNFAAVKAFIRNVADHCHVEVTTLLIPGINDSDSEISEIAGFISSINPATPFHISAYYPSYNYTRPGTTPDQIKRAIGTASDALQYVYSGNIPGTNDTRCPECNEILVRRSGYRVERSGLSGGRCTSCGAKTGLIDA